MSGGTGADDFVVGEDSYFSDSQVYIQDFNPSEGDWIVISDLSLDQVGFEETTDGVVFYELDTDFSFALVAGVSFAQIQNSLVSAYDDPSINLPQSIDISGDWTYRAPIFGPETVVSTEEYESIVNIIQENSSFSSEGGYAFYSPRGGSDYSAIASGSIVGDKILSYESPFLWSGVISADQKTITGTAESLSFSTKFDFVMTRDDASETPTPTPTPTPSTGDLEQQVLVLVNQERAKVGLQPLTFESHLIQAAETHSQNMALQDFVSHTGADGSEPSDRIRATGFQITGLWGENIFIGGSTPEQAVNWWMNSPDHRASILDSDFTQIGVGHYFLANDTGNENWNHYWTQVFSS